MTDLPLPGRVARTAILLAAAAGTFAIAYAALAQPLPPIIPLLLYDFADESVAGLAAVPAFFLAWSVPQWRGSAVLPILSIALATLVTLLSAMWFVVGWEYGMEYQNPVWVWLWLSVNAAVAIGMSVSAWHLRRKPYWSGVVAWHVGLLGWMTFSAFPYLGEMP